LSAEEEPKEEAVEALIQAWREEHQQAEKRASEDAHVRELEAELGRLKQENEQLSFASRAAKERAAALAEEVDVLTGEREGASALVRRAEERAATAVELRSQLDERIAELERRSAALERALESGSSTMSSGRRSPRGTASRPLCATPASPTKVSVSSWCEPSRTRSARCPTL
jgi:chromosome segregation ATPase